MGLWLVGCFSVVCPASLNFLYENGLGFFSVFVSLVQLERIVLLDLGRK